LSSFSMRLLRVFSHMERCFFSSLLGGEDGGSMAEGLRGIGESLDTPTEGKWKIRGGPWVEG
jgi:hypothetical protein